MKKVLPAFMVIVILALALADPALARDPGNLGSADSLGLPRVSLGTGARGVINVLSFVAGAMAVIFLIIGGIRYITSSGNPQQIDSAKRTITYAIAGLVVVILATAIVAFVTAVAPQSL